MSRLEKHRARRRRDREKPFAQDSFREAEAGNCQSAKEILGKFWLASGTGERGASGGRRPGRKRDAPGRLRRRYYYPRVEKFRTRPARRVFRAAFASLYNAY